jgi:DNA polymerase
MKTLHIDFETYSPVDLRTAGLANYASNNFTGVHCLGYCFDDGDVELFNFHNNPIPDNHPMLRHIAGGGEVVAHNIDFELYIWNLILVPKYKYPPIKIEQTRCTMAQAYAMALPGSLDGASKALGIDMKKDLVGARVMMQLAKPRPDGTLWRYDDNPEKFEALFAYCRQDVEVERELDHRMWHLSPQEQNFWMLDHKINKRGVQIDKENIFKAIRLVEAERARLDADMLRVTGGVVSRCTEVQLLVKWIRSEGVEIDGVAKADVVDALAGDLPRGVRNALALRKEAAKSSTAKLRAMHDRASADNRVRGTLQYHGASTGRAAGRGIQVQNFPRPRPITKPKDIEDIIAHVDDREYIDINYGPVMDAMADCLRGMILAKDGHELIAMDFSAIEARALAWLAGEEEVLKIFRTHGKIYEHAAAGIYNKKIEDVTKDERQIGKVAILALGYGGGVGAFQSMARIYGVKVDDQKADEIKAAWRQSNKRIVQYWRDLECAAIDAVDLGVKTCAGFIGREVQFRKNGSFLWCRLPSGRVICYPYPLIKNRTTPWGEEKPSLHFMTVSGVTGKWEETSTYGGSLAENVTQAVARDFLYSAIERLEQNNFPIVFHAHDEVVTEIPTDNANALHEVERLMTVLPAWAEGMPLAAEGWRGKRYRK